MADATQVQPAEASSSQRPIDEARPGRKVQRTFSPAPRGGGRGRMQQSGHTPGVHGVPPGLGPQRQHQQQQRGWPGQDGGGSRYQNGEPHSDLVVGTQMQGFVDHVREKFGFIRVADMGEPVFFHVSEVQAEQPTDKGATAASVSAEEQGAANGGEAAAPGAQQPPAAADAEAASPAPEQQSAPAEAEEQPKQEAERGRQKDRKAVNVDLATLLQPGDAVEFIVAASSHDGVRHRGNRAPRMMAKQVCKLPAGALAAVTVGEERVQGRVERALVGGGAASDTWTNRESSGGQGGLVSYLDPEAAAAAAAAAAGASPAGGAGEEAAVPRLFLPFDGEDVKGRGARQLKRGDPVEFRISSDARTGKRRATQVQPVKQVSKQGDAPEARREQGFVDKFVNTYGFVRSVEREGGPPMFFHISEVAGGAGSGVGAGAEVSFAVVPDPTAAGRGEKFNAVQLEVLPPGTVAEERAWPGRVNGRVLRPAAKAAEEGQTPASGKVTFEEEAGNVRSCFYTLEQVMGGEEAAAALGHDDEVEFGVVTNRRTGVHRAEGLALLCKAEHRRELGQVKQLHEGKEAGQGFGFIRPCERAGDLFFHFSQLSGVAAGELRVGDDVEFSVVRDPTPEAPKRVVASRVTRAPQGSAVFDVVSERVYAGVVLERMHAKGTNITSGLLQYKDDAGLPAKLTYGPKDLLDAKSNPKQLDHVTFRTAVNPRAARAAEKLGGAAALHAGRRATQVALPVYSGKMVTFKGTFGFLEYDRGAPAAGSPSSSSKAAAAEEADAAADATTSGSAADGLGGEAGADASASEAAAADREGAGGAEKDGAAAAAEKGGGGASGSAASSRALPRMYFSANDVEGNVALKAGDEVRFTIASKAGRGGGGDGAAAGSGSDRERGGGATSASRELVARRVLRTKEAPAREEEVFVAERNPQAIKFINNLAQQGGAAKIRDAVRMAKGPDGTKGFAPGRGRPLPPAPPGGDPAPAPAPGSALHSVGSGGALNPTAAEFVPRLLSKDLGPAARAAAAAEPDAAPSGAKAAEAAPLAAPAAGLPTEGTSPAPAPAEGAPAPGLPTPLGGPIAYVEAGSSAGETPLDAVPAPPAEPAVDAPSATAPESGAAEPDSSDSAPARGNDSAFGGTAAAAAPVSESSVHGSDQVSELASALSGASLTEQQQQQQQQQQQEGLATGSTGGLMEGLAHSAASAVVAASGAREAAQGAAEHQGQPGGALMGLDGEGAAI